MKRSLLLAFAALMVSGCMSAADHRADVRDDTSDRISVGTVQKEIRVGMSGADVVAVLGSPNMVTTDAERRETWVYDKVATERVYSRSSAEGGGGGGGAAGGGSGGGVLGLIFGGSASSGASSTTQRTLTIIIKFDHNNLVRDFSYRQSSF
ncbi:outer membrane protein assembly factor BamE [Desulfovibrio sp. OttesenSCG-928-C14]|nr:outer membrane protein assembly factor BamE [Desulfovibrio sp. OttesenSCG-928-C14]